MLILDTLAISKELKENGFSEQQSETLTRVFKDSSEQSLANLVTKADLERQINGLESRLDSKLNRVQSDFKEEIASVQGNLNTVESNLKEEIASVKSDFKRRDSQR